MKKQFTSKGSYFCQASDRKPMGFTLIELLVVIAMIAITTRSSINVKPRCFTPSLRLHFFITFFSLFMGFQLSILNYLSSICHQKYEVSHHFSKVLSAVPPPEYHGDRSCVHRQQRRQRQQLHPSLRQRGSRGISPRHLQNC